MSSKYNHELDHIVNNLVKKLDYESLDCLSVKLQIAVEKQAREGKINYAEECVETANYIVTTNKNIDKNKENVKKIAKDKFYQSYSSEYNDADDWIDFFIEKQSNMFHDNEKEVLDHFEEYVPHDF